MRFMLPPLRVGTCRQTMATARGHTETCGCSMSTDEAAAASVENRLGGCPSTSDNPHSQTSNSPAVAYSARVHLRTYFSVRMWALGPHPGKSIFRHAVSCASAFALEGVMLRSFESGKRT